MFRHRPTVAAIIVLAVAILAVAEPRAGDSTTLFVPELIIETAANPHRDSGVFVLDSDTKTPDSVRRDHKFSARRHRVSVGTHDPQRHTHQWITVQSPPFISLATFPSHGSVLPVSLRC